MDSAWAIFEITRNLTQYSHRCSWTVALDNNNLSSMRFFISMFIICFFCREATALDFKRCYDKFTPNTEQFDACIDEETAASKQRGDYGLKNGAYYNPPRSANQAPSFQISPNTCALNTMNSTYRLGERPSYAEALNACKNGTPIQRPQRRNMNCHSTPDGRGGFNTNCY